jgi:hypothetical protein
MWFRPMGLYKLMLCTPEQGVQCADHPANQGDCYRQQYEHNRGSRIRLPGGELRQEDSQRILAKT